MIQTTPEDFHAFRRKGLGGSDMAAICGISPWKTELDVYMRLKEGIDNTQIDEELVYWGQSLERNILDRYSSKVESKLKRNQQIVHPKYEFIRGNVDAVYENVLVEAKNIHGASFKNWFVNGEWIIPNHYKLQVVHYACILDPQKIEFAVLFGGNNFHIIPFERDLKLEKALLGKCIRWWEKYIIGNCKPKPTKLSDIQRYTKIVPDSKIEATKEIEELIAEINKLKPLTKKLAERESKLKLFMGANQNLIDTNGNTMATFKEVKGKRWDVKKLKQDDMYDEYSIQTTTKRLNIKGAKL